MAKQNRQILGIKHMVCPRCIAVVHDTLEEMGLKVFEVELGQAVIKADAAVSGEDIHKKLQEHDFELIRPRDQQRADDIKKFLGNYIDLLESSEESPKLSEYLAHQLHQNYTSLSSTFSDVEDITIEKFLIRLKIERVKTLLQIGSLTLSEIAWKLNYSSVAHLSSQFKQVTGMSPTDYKKARDSFHKPLDGIDES